MDRAGGVLGRQAPPRSAGASRWRKRPRARTACRAEHVGDGFDLEAAAADGEIAAHLHAAIEALPPLQRTLLTLYHLEEVPIGEISRITGLAEGTIKSHLFRTRKALRAVLEPRIGVAA